MQLEKGSNKQKRAGVDFTPPAVGTLITVSKINKKDGRECTDGKYHLEKGDTPSELRYLQSPAVSRWIEDEVLEENERYNKGEEVH